MKDRIAKSVFWIVWTRGGMQALSFLSTVVVIRLLAPSDYGLMALVGIWTATLSLVTEMGLGAAIIQFREISEHDLNACFWMTLGLGVVGYGVVFVMAPLSAQWFSSPELTAVLRVSGLSVLFTALRTVPDSLLRKQLALDKVSIAEFAAMAATFPLVLGLAWMGIGVWALVVGTLTTPFIQMLMMGWYVRWWPGLSIGHSTRFKEMVQYSLATLGSRLSWALYQQGDVFVLGKMGGDHILGLYSLAKQLATLPVSKVTPVVNQLAFPVMAELQADDHALRRSFLKGVRLVSAVVFPLCSGLLLMADSIVASVLDQAWGSIVPMFQVLCVYAIFSALASLLFPPLSVKRRLDLQVIYTTAQLVIMPVGFSIGVYWGGGIGLALVWVILYPVQLAWLAHWTLRELGISWQELGRHLWPQSMATACMALVVFWMKDVVGLASTFIWLQMMLCVLMGVVVYVGILKMAGPLLFAELMEIARWILGQKPALVTQAAPV